MAEPLGSMFIELGLDVSKFNPRLSSAKNAVKFFQQEVRGLDSVMKGSGRNIGTLQAKFKSLQQAIEAQKSVLSSMKKSFDELKPGTAQWEKQAVAIERENAKLAQLEAQLHGVGKAMDELNLKNTWLGKMETQLDKASGKFHKISEATGKLADKFAPVSASLAVGLGLATKKAIDFEGQMTTTRSLLSDTVPTVSELNRVTAKLGDNSKKWAKQYGISTTSINEGMQEIIKKGYNANQTIEAMPAILDAAKASGDDFGQVMEASTSILEQFGLKTKDTQRVTDSLTYVANKTAAGFSDMGNAMEYVGPVAKNVGMSLEDTAAAVGLLSNNGIKGEKAGTALRGALTRLLKPSDANAIAMQKLGFSAEEFRSGAIKLPDVLDRIKKNTEGMTDAQKAALIAQAFGTEAQSAMNILVDQGGDKLRKLSEETSKAKGYTHELAQEMMKSSKSGVERFKASLEVLQINIGQKLLPKLTPIIDKINGLIDAFDKASPSVQEFWTDLALGLAVAAPTLKFVSGLSGGISSLFKVASKTAGLLNTAKGIKAVGTAGELATGALGGATTAIETVGVTAGTTAESMGLLGAVMNPAGAIVLGTVAVAGGLAYLSHEQDKAREKAEEFGTTVDNQTRSKLREFRTVVDDTKKSISEFTTVAGDTTKVSEAFDKMYKSIADSANEANARVQELAGKWGLTDEQVKKAQEHNNQLVKNSQTMVDQIKEIYQRHNGDASKFSQEEKEIVLNNQNQLIEAKLQTLDLSAKQEKAIRVALNGDIQQLNETQLKSTKSSLEKLLSEENKSYKKSKDELKDLLDQKALTRSEYNERVEQLEGQHNTTMEALGEKLYNVSKALDLKLKDRTGQNWNYWEEAKKKLEEYGLSYDDIGKKAAEASRKAGNEHSILAKYTSDMSESAKSANDAWSVLVGTINKNNQLEVKSNVKEVIGEASKSAEGWNQLKIIAKDANLDSNARATIAESLVEVGKWNELTPDEKKLIVEGKEGLQSIFDSKHELEIWNSLPEQVKQLLLNNDDVMSKSSLAKQALDNYDRLTPQQKELLASDKDVQDAVSRSTTALTNWNISPIDVKNLVVDEKAGVASITVGVDKLAEWNGTTPISKSLNSDSTSTKTEVSNAIGSLSLFNGYQLPTKPLNSDSTPTDTASAQAKASLNSFNTYGINTRILPANESNAVNASNQAKTSFGTFNAFGISTRQLNAQDNASSVAAAAKRSIDSIPSHKTSIIDVIHNFFTRKHEKGTDYHQGGLAMVNDQKGSNYKELITLPTGEQFIPNGRNVVLPLPIGSKVLNATKTRQLMQNLGIPKYQNGVGIPSDAKFLKELDRVQSQITIKGDNKGIDIDKLVNEISDMKSVMATLLKALLDKDSSVYLDGKAIAESTYKQQARIMAREGI